MNLIDRLIGQVAPMAAVRRAQARMALRQIQMHYEAASVGPRTGHRRAPGTDADAAAARRARMANLARDMIRNTPIAARAQQVIANNVVGDGIIPKFLPPAGLSKSSHKALEDRALQLIERDLDTTAIDADGRQTLYGLQDIVVKAVVDAGEALVVRMSPRFAPLKVRVLESDYLDNSRQGPIDGGGWIKDGIEYDADSNRVAYYLFDEHPGSDNYARRVQYLARRIPADDVLHIYRQDRPGQMRGVSWFASVAVRLADLDDFHDAQLMRQKIAACFTAFVSTDQPPSAARKDEFRRIEPGLIQEIGSGEEVTFGTPPDSGDFDPFTRAILRSTASGLGLTYEALTGDLSTVNFSSARMGRVEMDRNVSGWQWKMLIPQMLQPMGRWILESWVRELNKVAGGVGAALIAEGEGKLDWVPPHKILVDPTREIPALIEAIEGGLTSRPSVIRSLGQDPERLDEEIAADNARMDDLGLKFSSDYRHSAGPRLPGRVNDEDADKELKDAAAARRPRRSLMHMFKGF